MCVGIRKSEHSTIWAFDFEEQASLPKWLIVFNGFQKPLNSGLECFLDSVGLYVEADAMSKHEYKMNRVLIIYVVIY